MTDQQGLSSGSASSGIGSAQKKSPTAAKVKTTGPIHNPRYKTSMCQHWEKSPDHTCPYDKKCQYAHGYDELHKWTKRKGEAAAAAAAAAAGGGTTVTSNNNNLVIVGGGGSAGTPTTTIMGTRSATSPTTTRVYAQQQQIRITQHQLQQQMMQQQQQGRVILQQQPTSPLRTAYSLTPYASSFHSPETSWSLHAPASPADSPIMVSIGTPFSSPQQPSMLSPPHHRVPVLTAPDVFSSPTMSVGVHTTPIESRAVLPPVEPSSLRRASITSVSTAASSHSGGGEGGDSYTPLVPTGGVPSSATLAARSSSLPQLFAADQELKEWLAQPLSTTSTLSPAVTMSPLSRRGSAPPVVLHQAGESPWTYISRTHGGGGGGPGTSSATSSQAGDLATDHQALGDVGHGAINMNTFL